MPYKNTDIEKVILKKHLYQIKDQAHFYFDQLWNLGYVGRNEAYQYLSEWMGVTEPEAHMRVMDIKRCREVVEWSIIMLNDMRRLDLDFGEDPKHPYYEIIEKTTKTIK